MSERVVSAEQPLTDEILRFVADFYPETNHNRRMEHLATEVLELRDAKGSEERSEEAADCALILFHIMLAEGTNPLEKMARKLRIARDRIETGVKKPRPFKEPMEPYNCGDCNSLPAMIQSATDQAERINAQMPKPISSVYASHESKRLEVYLDTSRNTYLDWIKGEGADIGLLRDQTTRQVVGVNLPLYAKSIVFSGENMPTARYELETGKPIVIRESFDCGDCDGPECCLCNPAPASVTVEVVSDGECEQCDQLRKLAEEIQSIFGSEYSDDSKWRASDLQDIIGILARHESAAIQELQRQVADLKARLAAAEKKNLHSLANNLCPDHRDKQQGKPCLACEIEGIARARDGWRDLANKYGANYYAMVKCRDNLQTRLAALEAQNAWLRELLTVRCGDFLSVIEGMEKAITDHAKHDQWAEAHLTRIRAALATEPAPTKEEVRHDLTLEDCERICRGEVVTKVATKEVK